MSGMRTTPSERLPIRIGGLMRCCIENLRSEYLGPQEEGAETHCQWCGEPVIVRDGAWEWNHKRMPEEIE